MTPTPPVVNNEWVVVRLPPWLGGGNLRGLLTAMGLQSRVVADGLRVCTDEAYRGTTADLVRPLGVQTAKGIQDMFELAAISDPRAEDDLLDAAQTVLNQPDTVSSLTEIMYRAQLELLAASGRDLAPATERALGWIGRLVKEETGQPMLPDVAVFAIQRRYELFGRMWLPRIFQSLRFDARFTDDGPPDPKIFDPQQLTFASGHELFSGHVMLDAYLGPFVGAMSPGVWCLAAYRSHGAILLSFGRPVSGSSSGPSELLQTIVLPGSQTNFDWSDGFSSDAPQQAVRWWSSRLNTVFAMLSDPVVFRAKDGDYDGTGHFQAALTVEQLFRRVHSALMCHRDAHARRVLMFSTIDTLTSLTGSQVSRLFTLSHAQKVLNHLRVSMPVAAQQILLPNAQAAVDALERVQTGFHLASPEKPFIRVGDKDLGLENATARYLTVLRNATHGHGSNKASAREEAQLLLASHTGGISHELGLLGYLYLLDYMANIDTHYLAPLRRFAAT